MDADLTGEEAPNRVLLFRFGNCFRYGSNDKSHAAAVVLSLCILLVVIMLFAATIAFTDKAWATPIITALLSAFTFTAGIAVGSGRREGKSDDD